jgi:PAS domain S-box-containing protein
LLAGDLASDYNARRGCSVDMKEPCKFRVLVVARDDVEASGMMARLEALGFDACRPPERARVAVVLDADAELVGRARQQVGVGGVVFAAGSDGSATSDLRHLDLDDAASAGAELTRVAAALQIDSLDDEIAAMRRELEQALGQIQELSLLADGSTRDPGTWLERAVRIIADHTDYRTAVAVLFDEVPPFRPAFMAVSPNVPPELRERLALTFATPEQPRRLAELVKGAQIIQVGALGIGAYFPSSRSVLLRNCSAIVKVEPRVLPRAGVNAWAHEDELVVPIVGSDGNYLGFLSVDDPRSGCAPTARSLMPIAALARQIAQAVEKTRLDRQAAAVADRASRATAELEETNARLQDTADEAGALYRASRLLLDTSGLDRLCRQIVDAVYEEFGYTRCGLLLVDADARALRDPTDRDVTVSLDGESICAEVVRTGAPRGFDAEVEPCRRSDLFDPATRSALVVPLRTGTSVLGVLTLESPLASAFSGRDERILSSFAERAALAIEQARTLESLHRAVQREATLKYEWEATFDAISDGVFIFDSCGRLTRQNTAASQLAGVAAEQLGSLRCCELLKSSATAGCAVEEAMASGRRILYEANWERIDRPTSMAIDVLKDTAGAIIGAVLIARDLSSLRRAEAEARRQQNLLGNLIENAYDAIFALDTAGHVTWLNVRAERLLGLPSTDVIGRNLKRFLNRSDFSRARRAIAALQPGRSGVFECTVRSSNGEIKHLVVTTTLIYADRRLTGVLGVARDVTDERRAAAREAEADKLRALGRLASGVAHDFNNLLAAILGQSQLIRRAVVEPGLLRRLDVIETAAQDGAATVRRIQEFARQRRDERATAVPLARLLASSVEITRTRWENEAQSRGVTYAVETVPIGADLHVFGQESELREVFVNLILNAIEAMPLGGTMTISALSADDEVTVRFRDEGVGIAASVRTELFEPYYTTKGESGTGLGLAVSYSIVTRHGGRIEVESEEGRGSTFDVTLPIAHDVSPDEECVGRDNALGSRRVLVIDDDDAVREVLSDILNEQGHEVVSARDGASAIELLRGKRFDLIFTDLSMPNMDGWDVARRCRELQPRSKIVLVTGYAGAIETPSDAPRIDAIVAKPFDYDEIAETCWALLGYVSS